MPIESASPWNTNNDTSDISSISSGPPSPASRSRACSSINDPRSSIDSSRPSPEAKPLLTWIYEGFCHILALIWNFFFPQQYETSRSRESSLYIPHISCNNLYLTLRGSGDSVESVPGSPSDSSGVLVPRGSEVSQSSSVPSNNISLDSKSTKSTRSTNNLVDDAHYLLSKSEDAIIPSFSGNIPEALNISRQRQKEIHEVLQIIGSSSVAELARQSGKLKELGDTIHNDVYPYRFLLEVLLDTNSKTSLTTIYEKNKSWLTSFVNILRIEDAVWSRFHTNLGKSFEKHKDDVATHTNFFVGVLKADYSSKTHANFKITPAQINRFVNEKNWNGLLEHLIKYTKIPNPAGAR